MKMMTKAKMKSQAWPNIKSTMMKMMTKAKMEKARAKKRAKAKPKAKPKPFTNLRLSKKN